MYAIEKRAVCENSIWLERRAYRMVSRMSSSNKVVRKEVKLQVVNVRFRPTADIRTTG